MDILFPQVKNTLFLFGTLKTWILVFKNIRGYTDILMLIQTNQKSLLGCFMTSIDSTKNGNSGTGESFLFRVAENIVNSWFWNENNPSIFAVFTKERYEK